MQIVSGMGWVSVAVGALLWSAGSSPAAVSEDLRLSEILAGPARDWDGDGAFDARADEWVELVNAGTSTVDLGAYRLSDADSTFRIALAGPLTPGACLVVTGKAAVDWQRAQGRPVTGLSLNNSGDTVRLFRVLGTDTLQVDARTYNSIEGASDRSVGRLSPAGDQWALFDGLNPYTGSGEPKGIGCPPTPGVTNQCPTSVKVTTWGRIKNLYR